MSVSVLYRANTWKTHPDLDELLVELRELAYKYTDICVVWIFNNFQRACLGYRGDNIPFLTYSGHPVAARSQIVLSYFTYLVGVCRLYQREMKTYVKYGLCMVLNTILEHDILTILGVETHSAYTYQDPLCGPDKRGYKSVHLTRFEHYKPLLLVLRGKFPKEIIRMIASYL